MVRGINEVFRPAGYSLVVSSVDGDSEVEEREVESHLSRQVDALIVCPRANASEVPQILETTSVPVIYAGTSPTRAAGVNGASGGVLSVALRETEVGEIATRYLLECRCRRIAYLRGPRTAVGDQRFAGFLEALRDAGVAVRQEWVAEIQPGISDYRGGFAVMKRLLGGRARPDGVVAYTDLLASGARDAAQTVGVDVPRTLQVIGSGNVAEICETQVGLTSVDLVAEEIGRRVARVALKRIAEKDAVQRSVLLSPRVVIRESTRS
jgi:LacI family transcriptional regulator